MTTFQLSCENNTGRGRKDVANVQYQLLAIYSNSNYNKSDFNYVTDQTVYSGPRRGNKRTRVENEKKELCTCLMDSWRKEKKGKFYERDLRTNRFVEIKFPLYFSFVNEFHGNII